MARDMNAHHTSSDDALVAVWRDHHRYVLDVAYRMLGSVTEAEDVFVQLLSRDLDEIHDVRGWLVVAVTRRCLDELRSARRGAMSTSAPGCRSPSFRWQAPSAILPTR